MPPAKRRRTDSSPTKSSPLRNSTRATNGNFPKSPLKNKSKPPNGLAVRPESRARVDFEGEENDIEGDGSEEEELYSSESDYGQNGFNEGGTDNTPSFVTASPGDAYFLLRASPSKTSDALLSNFIDPAFTFSSYASALDAYDHSPAAESVTSNIVDAVETHILKFPNWFFELDQGFNILLWGLGSKRDLLNEFAEQASERGDVITINGYDRAVSVGDVMSVLENLVREEADEDHDALPSSEGRSSRKDAKGKGKEKAASSANRYLRPPPGSALEGRARRICEAIGRRRRTPKPVGDIFLVIHSMDGPVLRVFKTLSVFALLAAQPEIHLIASIDHIRAGLLFTSSLATARPPHMMEETERHGKKNGTNGTTDQHAHGASFQDTRAFTFLYHETPTLKPYDVEVINAGTLSQLLPPSVFPRVPTLASQDSSSMAQSTAYVLASVTERSRRIFALLASMQLATFSTLDSRTARNLLLTPPMHAPSPQIATSLAVLQERAVDQLYAPHKDQVDALLSEFKDHGVVRSGLIAPENTEDDGTPEWVWIPLDKSDIEEILEDLGGAIIE